MLKKVSVESAERLNHPIRSFVHLIDPHLSCPRLAPALAACGTIVLKPASDTPLTALAPTRIATYGHSSGRDLSAKVSQSLLELCDQAVDIAHWEGLGYFQSTPEPYAELGEIVAGLKPGRERAEERTMAINLGLALEDMAVAPEVYRRAVEMGLGTRLPL